MIKPVILLLSVALLISCGGGSDEIEVPFVSLAGDFSGEWPVRNYVLRSESEWETAWLEHTPALSPPPEKPVVNFQTNVLLGVSLGLSRGGCESVAIVRVTRAAANHLVEYRQNTPSGLNFGCTGDQAALISLAVVSAPVGDVVFKRVD
jgi:hypothetical protein